MKKQPLTINMEAKAPPGLITPCNNSVESLDINALNLNPTDASMPEREEATPEFSLEHYRTRLPHVQEASRRLQNALDVRNEDFWPVPSKAGSEIDSITYAVNVAALGNALKDCGKYYVAMDRSSEREEFIDVTVKEIQKRKIKAVAKTEQGVAAVEGDKNGKKKKNRKKKGKGKEAQEQQADLDIVAAGGQESPVDTGQVTPDQEQDTPIPAGSATKIGGEVCSSAGLSTFRAELTPQKH